MDRSLLVALLFAATTGLGVWLSLLGRPYGVPLLTAHKLIALAATLTALALLRSATAARALAGGTVVAIAIVVAAVITLFATGGLMSAGKLPVSTGRTVHAVATVVAAALAVVVAVLLRRR
jgi:hypothetical protein